ncbi:MAG: sigma-70 family RNA polymerase sigma factor [Geminicoccaceae bacterium]
MNSDYLADAALIADVKAGRGAASQELVQRHMGPLTAFANRLLNDHAAAEDVAQTTILKLWRQAASWQPQAKLSTWLHKVAYRDCLDRIARNREILSDDLPEQMDDRATPDQALFAKQIQTQIDAAIERLPERQRRALALQHVHQLRPPEIAETMGLSLEAVESLLSRARRNLRKDLAALHDELMGGL